MTGLKQDRVYTDQHIFLGGRMFRYIRIAPSEFVIQQLAPDGVTWRRYGLVFLESDAKRIVAIGNGTL